MNLRASFRQMTSLLFALILMSAIALLFLYLGDQPTIQIAPELASNQASVANAEVNEKAADISAMRWQAMARFYQGQGLLTRDPFDYGQAADQVAFRWQAMAEAYQRHGLLNYGSNPDDVMAFRWQAMAKAYEKAGLLNDQSDAGDLSPSAGP